MPATRTVHSPYPTGQGSATVPVLFSLPNVQPAIAAASSGVVADSATRSGVVADSATRVTSGRTEARAEVSMTETTVVANNAPFESSPIVVSPNNGQNPRSDSWQSKLTSQMTNITIVVLLVAVTGLAYRNMQPTHGDKSLSEPTAVAQATEFHESKGSPTVIPEEPLQAAPLHIEPVNTNSSALSIAEPAKESLVVEKGAIPLLLPPASQGSLEKPVDKTANDVAPNTSPAPGTSVSGPYGSVANGPAANPFSLTSSKVGVPQAAPTTPGNASSGDRSRWEAVETDTPSLNTRDIILLRNGQRRTESGTADPGLPKVESVMRPQAGSRSLPSSNGATPMMTGQSYPPIAPQYEPISMPKSSPSRITQPATEPSQKPAPKQYIPLSPVLPNPSEANGFDSRNP